MKAPKLTPRKAWTARGGVIESRTHAARIGEYLADGDESGEGSCESEAYNPVQPGSDSEATDGSKDSFPRQPIMIQSTSSAIEFNRNGDAGCNPGNYTKKEPKAQAIADAEDQRVCDSSCKQAQRAVLSAEQVISKVEAAYHIKTSTRNADGCECVVVHSR